MFRFPMASIGALVGLVVAGSITVVDTGPAGADQIGSLKAQARVISQKLVQEQLEIDGYQQQYSVASAKVAADAQAIAAIGEQLGQEQVQFAADTRQVRALAISSYMSGGGLTGSDASLFVGNSEEVQSANEYDAIANGEHPDRAGPAAERAGRVGGPTGVVAPATGPGPVRPDPGGRGAVPGQRHRERHGVGAEPRHGTAVGRRGGTGRGPGQSGDGRGVVGAESRRQGSRAWRQARVRVVTRSRWRSRSRRRCRSRTSDGRSRPAAVPPVCRPGRVGRALQRGVAQRDVHGCVPVQSVDVEFRGAGGRTRLPRRGATQPGVEARAGHRGRGAVRTRRRTPLAPDRCSS